MNRNNKNIVHYVTVAHLIKRTQALQTSRKKAV